jgi:hypothetical protein
MTYTYVQISSDAGSTYKKYDLEFTNAAVYPIPDTPSEWSATLNGDSTVSFGASKYVITLPLQVLRTDTRTNYGSLSDALGYFSAVTTAANQLRVRLMDYDTAATTYTCVLMNKSRPDVTCKSVDPYAADSVHVLELQLRQV